MAAAISEAQIVERVRTDREFHAYSTGWNDTVEFAIGDDRWVAIIADGRLEAFTRGANPDASIRLEASEQVWGHLWDEQPAPGFTGLDVAAARGLRIEGDPVASVGPYFPALQRLVQLMGHADGRKKRVDAPSIRETDTARTRYVYVTVDGIEYRISIQESGQGIPLVLQHTAGADSRQWRHVLADPELQSRYRMIAVDLPFHGKSLPPRLDRWWKQEYHIAGSDLMKRLLAVVAALELDRPIYLGWGKLGVELAVQHSDQFRAIVALNPVLQHEAARVHDPALFHHPQISESYFGALEYGKTSSQGPEANRREIHWIVTSNGLGVYKGDYEYETADGDLRESLATIDTSSTPLWLVAGEYDPASLDRTGGTAALAAEIPGATYRRFDGVGGVGDNPTEFSRQIRSLLEEAADRSATVGS